MKLSTKPFVLLNCQFPLKSPNVDLQWASGRADHDAAFPLWRQKDKRRWYAQGPGDGERRRYRSLPRTDGRAAADRCAALIAFLVPYWLGNAAFIIWRQPAHRPRGLAHCLHVVLHFKSIWIVKRSPCKSSRTNSYVWRRDFTTQGDNELCAFQNFNRSKQSFSHTYLFIMSCSFSPLIAVFSIWFIHRLF